MTDVQRASWICRDEFDYDRSVAAVGCTTVILVACDDVANPCRDSTWIQPEIQEARSRNLDAVDASVREVDIVANRNGDLGWLATKRARKHHRDVACPIGESRVSRTLQQRLDVVGRADAQRRSFELGADAIRKIHSDALVGVTGLAGVSDALGDASPPDFASVGLEPDEAESLPDAEDPPDVLPSPEEAAGAASLLDSDVLRPALFWSFLPSLP